MKLKTILLIATVIVGSCMTSCNNKAIPNEFAEVAGPQCYHQDDYSIFYNNIKANVAKRVAAYLSKQK